jgi:hypothetical protein
MTSGASIRVAAVTLRAMMNRPSEAGGCGHEGLTSMSFEYRSIEYSTIQRFRPVCYRLVTDSGPGALKGGLGRAGKPARLVLKDYFHVMSFRTRPRRGPSPGFSPPGSADALSRYLASARSFGHATRWIGNELDLIHRYRDAGRP